MRNIKYIAVHCTASSQVWGVGELNMEFKHKGWKNPGYHYVVLANGLIHQMLDDAKISNGVKGFNAETINVAYVGGINENGKATDNRTEEQKIGLKGLLKVLKKRYPNAVIQGHRDFSPDLNHNGKVDTWERIKECPCFDAKEEYANI